MLESVRRYHCLLPHRNEKLFSEFLPQAHSLVTLSCVPINTKEEVVLIKTLLGLYITFYDDFADNPKLANDNLLRELYKIPFNKSSLNIQNLNNQEREFIELSIDISEEIMTRLFILPNYLILKSIFEFDLKQFYHCNDYYSLAQKHKNLLNSCEISIFGPFNMGIVIAGTIDLMASKDFLRRELGQIRHLFMVAQRFAHICNSVTTIARELSEGTCTNEAIILALETGAIGQHQLTMLNTPEILACLAPAFELLSREQEKILDELTSRASAIKSFDGMLFAENIAKLKALHYSFAGNI